MICLPRYQELMKNFIQFIKANYRALLYITLWMTMLRADIMFYFQQAIITPVYHWLPLEM